MSKQGELFAGGIVIRYVDHDYPNQPGFKEHTTSRDAALKMKRRQVDKLRDRVLLALKSAGAHGMTPDECAAEMGLTVLSTRPRFTELKMLDKIERSGARRKNASGRSANVWVAK